MFPIDRQEADYAISDGDQPQQVDSSSRDSDHSDRSIGEELEANFYARNDLSSPMGSVALRNRNMQRSRRQFVERHAREQARSSQGIPWQRIEYMAMAGLIILGGRSAVQKVSQQVSQMFQKQSLTCPPNVLCCIDSLGGKGKCWDTCTLGDPKAQKSFLSDSNPGTAPFFVHVVETPSADDLKGIRLEYDSETWSAVKESMQSMPQSLKSNYQQQLMSQSDTEPWANLCALYEKLSCPADTVIETTA